MVERASNFWKQEFPVSWPESWNRSLKNEFGIFLQIIKFTRFPAIMFQYDQTIQKLSDLPVVFLRVNATFLWISGLILQIITTLTSAYSTFNVLIDRLFIKKIKVNCIVKNCPKIENIFRLLVNLQQFLTCLLLP